MFARSTTMGNAKASTSGTSNKYGSHAFLYTLNVEVESPETFYNKMKKYLFLLLALVSSFSLRAADYDETNLVGLWKLESSQGEYYPFSTNEDFWQRTPTYIYLGTISNSSQFPNEEWEIDAGYYDHCTGGYIVAEDDGEDYCNAVNDFFISNGNKLHIVEDDMTFRFIIENLTAQELCLKSYDGKFMATYKRTDATSVKSVEVSAAPSTEEYYNLNGVKQNRPHHGVNIIRRGSHFSKEIR